MQHFTTKKYFYGFLFTLFGIAVQAQPIVTTISSPSKHTLNSVYSPCSCVSVAVGDSVILISGDLGDTWRSVSDTFTSSLLTVFFPSEHIGYAGGISANDVATILKTTDGGKKWENLPAPVTYRQVSSLFFTNDTIGYLVAQDTNVYKTTDGGQHWDTITPPKAGNYGWNQVFFADAQHGYLLGLTYTGNNNYGAIFSKTINGGATWSAADTIFIAPKQQPYSEFFVNDTLGFITATRGETQPNSALVRTTDGGATFAANPYGFDLYLSGLYFLNTDTGFISGQNGTLLYTSDGGNSVTALQTNTTALLSDVNFTPDSAVGLAVGNNGTILKINFAQNTTAVVQASGLAGTNIYPNPSSGGSFTINAGSASAYQVNVLNSLGQQVYSQAATSNTTSISMPTTTPGIYYIEIITSQGTAIQKLILN